ncbi:hypothetical protein DNTS_008716 [Danionella cerebrum]|nr:hypothetical protein DNTS_008716 [Danionella translucida]
MTRVVLEMFKYLQYSKLFFQWKLWYNNDQTNFVKLDFYLPPSTGHSDANPTPVVVFVYGGAWGSGDRSMYCLLALQMAKELNASVICPDYSIYPKGNTLSMIQDISDSLLWVRQNGHAFKVDQDNIILIGHSAGAHLCVLTTLFLINTVEELFIETSRQRELVAAIKGIIGLSGVYNIMDHYEHEKTRGVEYVSTMHKAMDGLNNFAYYSPTSILKKMKEDQLKQVPPVALLHGTNDIVVPVESSLKLSELLASLSVKMSLYLIPKLNHTDMVTDLMAADRHFYNILYDFLKQEFCTFLNKLY